MLFSITAVQLYNFSGDLKTTSISSNQTATHIVPIIMVFNNFWIIAGTVCNPTAVCYTKMNHDICLLSGFHCMKSHSLLAGRLWLCLVLRSGFHCLRYQADHLGLARNDGIVLRKHLIPLRFQHRFTVYHLVSW